MKIKNILKGAACLLVAVTLSGCSSDYLDLKPLTAEDTSTVSSSAKGMRLGLYGACRAMYMQYGALDGYLFVNGEPWISEFYGEVFGEDYYSYFWANAMQNSNMNWEQMSRTGGWQPRIGWMYCYNLINMVNNILVGVETAEGSKTEINLRHAQALTLRAHAYIRLLQIYAPRWQDSNNGNTYCLVIRRPGDGINLPVSTMNEVLTQIYTDLDDAIALYDAVKENGDYKRDYMWEPDKSVAQGLYARAALLKEDWATAEKMAHDARQGYDIMTLEQYKAGFCEPNQEWMWNNAADPEGMWFWAFGAVYACNGVYPAYWGNGSGAMNIDLYRKMDPNDGRRSIYLMPDNLIAMGFRGVTEATFWNKNSVNPVNMSTNGTDNRLKMAVRSYSQQIKPNPEFNDAFTAPKTSGQDEVQTSSDMVIPLGAQMKFWALDGMGTTAFPFMRGAEMLLIEAEAAYHNNNPSVAVSCLNELNKKRINGYNCNKSGEALLEEIRLSRRIELFGEGFNWFDMKRWNLPIVRRAWVEGDVTSGNIPAVNAKTFEPDVHEGWRFAFPRSESDYNHGIDINLINH